MSELVATNKTCAIVACPALVHVRTFHRQSGGQKRGAL